MAWAKLVVSPAQPRGVASVQVLRPAPEARGIGLSAYLIPAGAFLGGGLLIAFFLARQTRAREPETPGPPVRDPEAERIVDEELAG